MKNHTRVVDSSFDAVAESAAEFGFFVLQFLVDTRVGADSISKERTSIFHLFRFLFFDRKDLRVVRKVGKLIRHVVAREGGFFLGAKILLVSAPGLNPSGKLLNGGGESVRRVIGGNGSRG